MLFRPRRHYNALAWAESSAFVLIGGVTIAQRLADFGRFGSCEWRKSRYCHGHRMVGRL